MIDYDILAYLIRSNVQIVKSQNESVMHFFIECLTAKKLWLDLKRYLKEWYNLNYGFTHKTVYSMKGRIVL